MADRFRTGRLSSYHVGIKIICFKISSLNQDFFLVLEKPYILYSWIPLRTNSRQDITVFAFGVQIMVYSCKFFYWLIVQQTRYVYKLSSRNNFCRLNYALLSYNQYTLLTYKQKLSVSKNIFFPYFFSLCIDFLAPKNHKYCCLI